ncbi:EfeM/EfeO family lipoprotein [Wohlfahrtiimonas populi]|uniref:EfeM/EfeO family lipoprotein n=1 Tax=Wohlfahrtiimonas populi TaxID=1940240 RepID=UPI00130173BA|nr:EfeM/EfeO family lipoprotein [Wohlfahrtiimonas populi]
MKHILLCLILLIASSISSAQEANLAHKVATQKYFNFSIERLKNTEEYLERLLHKLEAGQTEAAKEDYIKAHFQYESVRPLILLFPNLNNLVDSHLEQLPKDHNSLGFVGFHALEHELFVKQDTVRSLVETQKLINNLRVVIEFMKKQEITCFHLMNILPVFTQQIINNKLSGHDSIYSESGLSEIAANLEGIQLIIDQTKGFLPKNLVAELTQSEDNIYKILAQYKKDDIHQPFSTLKTSDKEAIYEETQHLSELLIQLNTVIQNSSQHLRFRSATHKKRDA